MAWIKFLHVLVAFIWVAGLMVGTRAGISALGETVDVQRRMLDFARRVLRMSRFFGLLPTWILGLTLLFQSPGGAARFFTEPGGTFHIKILLVVIFTGMHHMATAKVKKIAADPGTHHSPKPFYVAHHVSAACLLGILFALYVIGLR